MIAIGPGVALRVPKCPFLCEVECLTAGDDQMIEGADIHQPQHFALWTGVRNDEDEVLFDLLSRNRMDRPSHYYVGRVKH